MQIELFAALKSIRIADRTAKQVVETIDATIDGRIELSAQSLKSEMAALRTSMEARMTSLQESMRLQLNVITVLIAVLGLIGVTAPIWSRFVP
jgi:hypothetical protein